MTSHILGKIFERNGILTVSPLGEKFDPNMHEALFELDDPKLQPGNCGHIAQIGYKIGDRCLRPARVGVVKARPTAEEAKPEDTKKE
jgi:molecular chaperone GrpE